MMGHSPSSSEGSYHSPPDAYQHHLLSDLDEDKAAIFHPGVHIPPVKPTTPDAGPEFEGGGHSFGVSLAQRFALPNQPSHINFPNLFFPRNESSGGGVPASAPANVTNFPAEGLRIAQGHIRTRSVQGEPPSASLLSPGSPLAQSAWMPEDFEQAVRNGGGQGQTHPSYDTSQGDSWGRKAFAAQPPPDRRGVVPSSVPNDFAPIGFAHHNRSHQGQLLDNVPNTPATVSPGVYQLGFSFPGNKPPGPSTTPRAVPTKQERRGSFSSSPYSPRSRPLSGLSLGALRGISDSTATRSSLAREGASEEEALPSAGLNNLHRSPFEGILPEESQIGLMRE